MARLCVFIVKFRKIIPQLGLDIGQHHSPPTVCGKRIVWIEDHVFIRERVQQLGQHVDQ